MQIEHKVFQCDVKATSSDGSKWEGHGNTFYTIDAAQEIVDIGAFTDTIPQFLENGFIGGLGHNWDDPIGKPMNAKEDTVGLWVDALCDVNSNEANKCRDLIKKKIVKQLSIGYRVKASEWLETAEDVAAYWESRGYQPRPADVAAAQYGARLLTKVHLYEVSPVVVAANFYSNIERVKRFSPDEIPTAREIEEALRRDVGLSRKNATAFVLHGYKGLQRDADEAATPEPQSEPEPEPETETLSEPETVAEPVVEALAAPVVTVEKASQEEVRALYSAFLSQHGRK